MAEPASTPSGEGGNSELAGSSVRPAGTEVPSDANATVGSPFGPLGRVRRGSLQSPLLRNRETVFPLIESASPAAEGRLRASLELTRQSLRSAKDTRERLGIAPWEESRFSAFVALPQGQSLVVLGSDFAVTASPQQSLEWYQASWALSPSEESRAAALDLLARHERTRKSMQCRIGARVRSITDSRPAMPEESAYLIVDGTLVRLAASDSPQLADIFRQFREALSSAEEEAVSACR